MLPILPDKQHSTLIFAYLASVNHCPPRSPKRGFPPQIGLTINLTNTSPTGRNRTFQPSQVLPILHTIQEHIVGCTAPTREAVKNQIKFNIMIKHTEGLTALFFISFRKFFRNENPNLNDCCFFDCCCYQFLIKNIPLFCCSRSFFILFLFQINIDQHICTLSRC